MSKLFLFTISYPYTKAEEGTFLVEEISLLLKYFDEITIIPMVTGGKKDNLSKNVKLDNSLSDYIKENERNVALLFKAFYNRIFFTEIIGLLFQLKFKKFKKSVSYLYSAYKVKMWFIKNYGEIEQENYLFYTYWCTATTLGLGILKEKYPNSKLITRAHNIDIYEERGFIYLREKTLAFVDRFYVISEDGYNYIVKNYPQFNAKIKVSGLGVKNLGFITQASNDGIFRIVSCSSVDKNKRVQLILQGIIELLDKKAEIRIEWNHFGAGPLFKELKKEISDYKIDKLKINLFGWVENDDLLNYYKNNCVDLFISLSAYEGRPVSMLEVQSYGIPILATAVGGVPEIVVPEVGLLLNKNPTPKEIANGISYFMNHPNEAQKMRLSSIKNWETNFNAEKNFDLFAKELKAL